MEKVDIAIIGAGVVGLAIARELAANNRNIIVLEKMGFLGLGTSSRNSEVIHAGLYYPKGSQKSDLCIRGRDLLYELCAKHNVPHKKLGKLLVACDKEELTTLEGIYQNALECGIENLSFLDKKEIRKLEPDVTAERGILSSDTGIIDSHKLMDFLYTSAKREDVDFAFNVKVINIESTGSFYEITVKEPQGDLFTFQANTVINSSGLSSDKIANMVGLNINGYKLHYCKGQYFRIRNPKKFSVTHPVYPPPTSIDLGIHLTPDMAGGLRLGPDANYVSEINYDIDESASKQFYDSVRRFLPSLEKEDIIPDTAGVRPKLQAAGDTFKDFVISNEENNRAPNFINLIGIESPGLTACLAIAEKVKTLIRK